VTKYIKYDISNQYFPDPILKHLPELELALKKFAIKEVYDDYEKDITEGVENPYSIFAPSGRCALIPDSELMDLAIPIKKCFPSLLFRWSGNFIYGPGDTLSEHTNANDSTNTMYITYATGNSKFSYRHSVKEEFIDTYDMVNGITLRSFKPGNNPYVFHKVNCESGYRVSIGIKYIKEEEWMKNQIGL
jgi:hypothetical protein